MCSGLQDHRGESRMIGRVREMLRLHAESRTPSVDLARLTVQSSVQKVARVKLKTGLRREHFHHATRLRLSHLGGRFRPRSRAVQHPVVIVAGPEFYLLVARVDPLPNRRGSTKIESRACDIPQLAGGNHPLVDSPALV